MRMPPLAPTKPLEVALPAPRSRSKRLPARVLVCEGGLGFMNEALVRSAWEGSPLAQRGFPTWESYWEYQKQFHADAYQVQIVILDGETCVGGIVLHPCEDAQVGECLLALHTFILPEYRSAANLRTLREKARRVAREAGIRWLVYPRGTPEGVLHKYMEV
ncbi:hypothetical protein [Ralstonia phage phiITL-1]|uniref:Uncharacterized protein n=1 Tax=Ralstonia phage phiITL-1 TaxID=1597967 RepID=A0A0U1ZGV3_9CAUD|nr:hypothetical protein HOR02_gp48 [Ralstonia phage phiITL-1]AJT60832.1 hypothetical protein [Ralstonia phage phiITL-1]